MRKPIILAMIPARMGSQRLKQKNLRVLRGISLIARAVRKCKETGIFHEIWVNSEHPAFGDIAEAEGVHFHRRPEELGSNSATSEQFVFEFLQKHKCDYIIQVHSIAPLLTPEEIKSFVQYFLESNYDVLLSNVDEQIECAYRGEPINFTYKEKTNSQDLLPVQRVTWSITGWKSHIFKTAYAKEECATYSGNVGYYPISRLAGIIIKTEEDLMMAEALYDMAF